MKKILRLAQPVMAKEQGLLPFSDNFNRADGALGGRWQGEGAFAVVSEMAQNTPATYGEDDISNGNMEAGDPPTGWTADGATLDSVADERTGGAGSKSLSVVNAGAAKGYADQALDYPDGTFVRVDLWMKKVTGNPQVQVTESDNTLTTSTGSASATWGAKYVICRLKGAGSKVRVLCNDTTAGHEARFDDVRARSLSLAELIKVVDAGRPGVVMQMGITNESFSCVGFAVCVDDAANPQNLLLAYVKGGDITLEKCVGGAWAAPRPIWTSITYVAGALLRLTVQRVGVELKLNLFYNGVQKGVEQTIADAGIIDNHLHGMLASDPDQPNRLDGFILAKN